MGLITEEVEVQLNSNNIKWYEEKGYEIPRNVDKNKILRIKKGTKIKVKTNDLPNYSSTLVDIKCDNCGKILIKIKWEKYVKYSKDDGKYYCQKCASKLFAGENGRITKLKNGTSFYDWCYNNLPKKEADEIMLRWDYEKNIKNGNKLSPKDVGYSSQGFNKKGYWFKCLDHPEHKPEIKRINSFTNNTKAIRGSLNCNQCNSVSITHPHLIKYFVNKNDPCKYSIGSHKNVLVRCPNCNNIRSIDIYKLFERNFSCPKCGDGFSFPNKFFYNVLIQLEIKFIREKTFEWCKFKIGNRDTIGIYDFYFELNKNKYIIEMDGEFHNKDNTLNGQTKEISKLIDGIKENLAYENNIEVIRIDSRKSELEYIKNNIINSNLATLFKLNNIDWQECYKFACSSFVKIACDLWANIQNTAKLADKLNISIPTVIKYLKQGSKLGWCNYDSKRKSKQVICLTNNKVFNSITCGANKYNIATTSISQCCKGRAKYAGKLKDGTKLKWMYYDEYIINNN